MSTLPPLVEPAADLTRDEVARYSRHLIIPEMGVTGQKRLKNAKVLVIGAGGLGSPALLYLAAAGVGTIGIVEFDEVDESNLQRQVIGDMLRDWDKRYPGRLETMFSAMQNVVPSHLSDINLFDFKGIHHGSAVVDGGDLAFDREDIPMQPVGWQPEDSDDAIPAPERLNVLEIK